MNLLVEIKVRLTEREAEVLNLFSKGMRRKEIMSLLRLSRSTVNLHAENAFAKLSASTAAEAVANAIRMGIIE